MVQTAFEVKGGQGDAGGRILRQRTMRVTGRKANKFRNVRTVVDGIAFASKREAARYQELKLLEKAGEIRGPIELQPRFPIEVAGYKICEYRGDFAYTDKNGRRVVEDVKSPATRNIPVYRLKKKLVKAVHGVDVVEV